MYERMYEELQSLDPRQRRRVEQRLAVLGYASTCTMHAAALYFGLSVPNGPPMALSVS